MSRFVRLIRSSRREPYGFEFKTLKLDGKHVAFNITPDSIADKCGLKNGDYILEVNDESVSGLWHDAVLMKMSMYSRRLDLLVVNDLSTFIKDRRSSIMTNNTNNDQNENGNDEFKQLVSKRTNLTTNKQKPLAERINQFENDFSDRNSIATSRSYREPIKSQTNTIRSINSTEHLNTIDTRKVTSTPKTNSKFTSQLSVAKPQIVFEGQSRYNPLINLTNAKAKLDEYGKNLKLIPNSKSNERNLYGFNFRTSKEGQHVITNILPDYPAHEAGIQDGDYILEVNGDIITSLSHNQVIRKIFSNPNHVELLIVKDLDAYLNARQVVSQIKQGKMSDQDANRYYIKKASKTQLGLNVVSNGIIASVDSYSPAEKSGLRKGLKIIRINDISLKDKTDHQIRKLIKDNENYMVIDAIRVFDTLDPYHTELDDLNDFEFVPPQDEKLDQIKASEVLTNVKLTPRKSFDTLDTDYVDDDDVDNDVKTIKIIRNSNHFSQQHKKQNSNINGYDEQIYSNKLLKKNSIYGNSNKTYHEITLDEDNLIGSRVINLKPRPDFDGFGFELVYDNRHNGPAEIKNVQTNSPAFMSGIRDNDLVLKINGKDVTNELYLNIVNMMREAEDKGPIELEVIDKNVYQSMSRTKSTPKNEDEPFSPNKQIKPKSDIRFKRCYLKLLPNFDGFGLTVSPNVKPKYSIYEVEKDSPAYKANLRKTDVIVEIDKINIRQFKFNDFFRLMQNGLANHQIEILAISLNGYYHYKDRNKRFSSKSLVTTDNTDLYST